MKIPGPGFVLPKRSKNVGSTVCGAILVRVGRPAAKRGHTLF